MLYREDERFSESKLENLYSSEYEKVPSIGDEDISEEDKRMLKSSCRELGLEQIIQ